MHLFATGKFLSSKDEQIYIQSVHPRVHCRLDKFGSEAPALDLPEVSTVTRDFPPALIVLPGKHLAQQLAHRLSKALGTRRLEDEVDIVRI